VVDGSQFTLEQDMESSIAPARSLRRQRPQALPHLELAVARTALVAHSAPMCANDATCPALRHLIPLLQMAHRCPTSLGVHGRYQFFAAMSFSAVLSSGTVGDNLLQPAILLLQLPQAPQLTHL
jgi:hypothetical protein